MKPDFCLLVLLFVLASVVVGCATGPSCNAVAGGPGTPSISFTSVPPIGSTNSLKGRVSHVVPAGYFVTAYIFVDGGFWIKPTFADPETTINCDGTWQTDITTGGVDTEATAITVFLLPQGFTAPLLSGENTLPASLYAVAVATANVNR